MLDPFTRKKQKALRIVRAFALKWDVQKQPEPTSELKTWALGRCYWTVNPSELLVPAGLVTVSG